MTIYLIYFGGTLYVFSRFNKSLTSLSLYSALIWDARVDTVISTYTASALCIESAVCNHWEATKSHILLSDVDIIGHINDINIQASCLSKYKSMVMRDEEPRNYIKGCDWEPHKKVWSPWMNTEKNHICKFFAAPIPALILACVRVCVCACVTYHIKQTLAN